MWAYTSMYLNISFLLLVSDAVVFYDWLPLNWTQLLVNYFLSKVSLCFLYRYMSKWLFIYEANGSFLHIRNQGDKREFSGKKTVAFLLSLVFDKKRTHCSEPMFWCHLTGMRIYMNEACTSVEGIEAKKIEEKEVHNVDWRIFVLEVNWRWQWHDGQWDCIYVIASWIRNEKKKFDKETRRSVCPIVYMMSMYIYK